MNIFHQICPFPPHSSAGSLHTGDWLRLSVSKEVALWLNVSAITSVPLWPFSAQQPYMEIPITFGPSITPVNRPKALSCSLPLSFSLFLSFSLSLSLSQHIQDCDHSLTPVHYLSLCLRQACCFYWSCSLCCQRWALVSTTCLDV